MIRKLIQAIGMLILVLPATTALAVTAEGPAANFTLKSTSGKNIRLSEHRGQVVLINFWASWCGPCRQEMPHLETLQTKYQDLGVTVLGINVEQDPAAYVKYRSAFRFCWTASQSSASYIKWTQCPPP